MKKSSGGLTLAWRWIIALVLALSFTSVFTAYAAPGALDPTFGGTGFVSHDMGGGQDEAWVVAAQPDGKVIFAGGNNAAPGGSFPDSDLTLARYNLNGTLDNSFGTNGVVTTDVNGAHHFDIIRAIALQPDGRIVVAGFTAILPNDNLILEDDDVVVARYNTNGTLDNTFGTGGIVVTHVGDSFDRARAVLILPDGRIAIAGYSYNTAAGRIDFLTARYNSNGTPDATYNADGNTDGWITTRNGDTWSQGFAAVLQPDGKMVVGGQNQNSIYMMARFNIDGALDNTFGTNGIVTTPEGNGHIYAMALQADGYIVTAGWTTSILYGHDFGLARYTPNGVLDPSFGTNGLVQNVVTSPGVDEAWGVAIQADGKIVASGVSNGNLAAVRLNTSGSPDTTFGTNGVVTYDTGFYDEGHGMTLLPDGKIVVVGNCNTIYCAIRLQIADRVWNGAGSDNHWSTAANWSGGVVPAAGEIAQFDSTSTKPAVVDGPVTVAGISVGLGYHSKVTLNNTLTVNGQAIIAPTSGLNANGNAFTATILQNNGAITQTLTVNGNTDVNFFNTGGFGGVTINANNVNLGNTRVIIYGNQQCDSQNTSVRRCFNITPTNATGLNAALTFYYAPSELNGSTCSTMNAYHWNGTNSSWDVALTVAARSCSAAPYSVQVTGVTDFSPFDLRSSTSPTAISIKQFSANSPLSMNWLLAVVGVLLIGLVVLQRKNK